MDSSKNNRLVKTCGADNELKTLLKNDRNLGWIAIYDKYAAVMYGNILNLTKDKALAEKIFIVAFKSLKEDQRGISIPCSIPLYLCAYAKQVTQKYLDANVK